MRVSITDPVNQTLIFTVVFLAILALTVRKKTNFGLTIDVTTELKGLAILTVIFGHIGYFLATDNRFLFPLSVASGVGVNLFLILSGYGLTVSALRKPLSIPQYFTKRLKKLYVPLWITLILFLFMDGVFLHKSIVPSEILPLFWGWVSYADLYKSFDSPLWYFSFIVLYYLFFPFLTYKKLIYISPLLVYGISRFLLLHHGPISIDQGVLNLYKVHLLAFPLGMVLALGSELSTKYHKIVTIPLLLRWILVPVLAAIIGYFAIHSGVGEGIDREQRISIFTSVCLIILAVIKPFELNLLKVFGKYSYEIYLFHWPIMYRYDFLYKYVPGFLATVGYLVVFVFLAMVFQKSEGLLWSRFKNGIKGAGQ